MPKKRLKRSSPIPEKPCYGGIDPGKDGFMVLFDGDDIIEAVPVPWLDRDPDLKGLLRIFAGWRKKGVVFAVLEHQQAFGKDSARNAFSLGGGFRALEMGLMALRIPFEVIRPSDWKRRLKIPIPKTKTNRDKALKARAIAKAQRFLPRYDFRRTPRCKGPHSGKAEAFLLSVLAKRIHKES